MSRVNKVTVEMDTDWVDVDPITVQRKKEGNKRKGDHDARLPRAESSPVISLTSGDDEPAARDKMAEVISQCMSKFAISSAARSSSEGP